MGSVLRFEQSSILVILGMRVTVSCRNLNSKLQFFLRLFDELHSIEFDNITCECDNNSFAKLNLNWFVLWTIDTN